MIARQIEDYTISVSQFDEKRPYIGLSQVIKSPQELIRDYFEGVSATRKEQLKCYKGNQMEKDLVRRIEILYGPRISHDEITAFGGLVKGHPDFWFDQFPGDAKSVLMDMWLPEPGRLPKRIYFQLNGYMHYSGKQKALCVFESRENGLIRDFWISYNPAIGREIHQKLEIVVGAIAKKQTPITI